MQISICHAHVVLLQDCLLHVCEQLKRNIYFIAAFILLHVKQQRPDSSKDLALYKPVTQYLRHTLGPDRLRQLRSAAAMQ